MQRTTTQHKFTQKVVISLMSVALVFSMLSLTACNSSNNATNPSSNITVKNQTSVQEIDRDVSIEKTTLIDIPEATISADSISFQNDSLKLTLTMTNKTSKPISIQAGTLGFSANYINNYMVDDGYIGTDLEPNESKTADVFFNSNLFKMFGINKIGEIGIGITIKNNQTSKDYSKVNYDLIHREVVSIKTSQYDSVDMNVDTYPEAITNEDLLHTLDLTILKFSKENSFDQNGISIKSLGLFKNTDGETSVALEIQNTNNLLVSANASDVTINNEMAYEGSWIGEAIALNKIAVMVITLNDVVNMAQDNENIQNIDLENISTVGIKFTVFDENSNTIVSPTELEFNF